MFSVVETFAWRRIVCTVLGSACVRINSVAHRCRSECTVTCGKKYADIATIRNTAARCREEGIPVGEKTLRRWVEEQKLPAVRTGRKILVSWQNLMDYLTVSA